MGSSQPSTALQAAESPATTQTTSLVWRILDPIVITGWLGLAVLVATHHEKWTDEAQAWLLARQLDLGTLWFKELRYEGSPGLWHTILWVAQRLHVPYAGLGVIGMLFAFAGMVLLVLRAPFPKPVSWLLAFSYFIVYQYAVIARPYVLLPLLAFTCAMLFNDLRHPERITIALVLLANVSAHGVLIAGCIGGMYLVRAALEWKNFDPAIRRKYVLSVAAMAGVLLFLFFVLKPPADVEGMELVHRRTLRGVLLRTWEGVDGAFFDYTPLTIAWLCALGVWSYIRTGLQKWLPLMMTLVLSVFYGFYGGLHHQGTIFVAAIAGLWIAWPSSEERTKMGLPREHIHTAMAAILACMLGYQVWLASITMKSDYLYPYSGGKETADYLKSVGADHQRIVGLGFGFVAVQAYFDHNLLVNWPNAFYHHSYPPISNRLAVVENYYPDYVVIQSWYDPDSDGPRYQKFMDAHGYSLAHVSDGYGFYKRIVETRQVYFIFRRNPRP